MEYGKYFEALQAEKIPLDKLISKIRRDLKIAATAASMTSAFELDTYMGNVDISPDTIRKNKQKASILYYLEELDRLKRTECN